MISERVRHARDFCGLTQVVLGESAGITQSKVSDIESGRTNATPEDVMGIAHATGFPVEFFHMGALPDLPEGNYRRLKRGKARVAKQVRAQARQIVELVQIAETQIAMPPIRLIPVADVTAATRIEDIAAEVREAAGVGQRDPIPNLVRAVERVGVVVAALPSDIPDHFGFSAWPDFGLDGRPFIFFARSDPGDRERFTVGHELGHLVLHSPLRREELDPREAEAEANRFAGALLFPEEAAREAMRPPITLTTLAHVKATYGISIGACIERARTLKYISEQRKVSLRKQLTSRGWHREEPVEVQFETPLLIRKVLDQMAKGQSVTERAHSLNMPSFTYRAVAAAN